MLNSKEVSTQKLYTQCKLALLETVKTISFEDGYKIHEVVMST